MPKTAISIDRDLADHAAQVLGTPTLTATVDAALRDVVERDARRAALDRLRERGFSDEEKELMGQAWR